MGKKDNANFILCLVLNIMLLPFKAHTFLFLNVDIWKLTKNKLHTKGYSFTHDSLHYRRVTNKKEPQKWCFDLSMNNIEKDCPLRAKEDQQ